MTKREREDGAKVWREMLYKFHANCMKTEAREGRGEGIWIIKRRVAKILFPVQQGEGWMDGGNTREKRIRRQRRA